MSDQTNCIIYNNPLRVRRGIWFTTCEANLHVKCSDLNRASDNDENFSCIRCTSLITDNTTTDIQVLPAQSQRAPLTNDQNPAIGNSNETVTATPEPWLNPTPELKQKLRTIYSQVVHWKLVFMFLARNRIGFNFIKTLNRTINSLIETQENSYAMHAIVIFSHLILCETELERERSNSKTIARRLKQWQKDELDELLTKEKRCAWQRVSNRKKILKHSNLIN